MDGTWFKYSEKGSRLLTSIKTRKRGNDRTSKVKAVIGIDRSGHDVLSQCFGELVKDKVFHIQTVNRYYIRLKQWLGRFHGVATKKLHKHIG